MDFKNILQTLSQLSESAKKSKPDFLDMDKDGDKKEPMKKAAKDAKKLKEGSASIGDTVKCPGGIRGKIISDLGSKWLVKDLDAETDDDELEFNKSDCEVVSDKKSSLKDWFERTDAKYIAEAGQGQNQVNIKPQTQRAQVIQVGNKPIASVTDPALAVRMKDAISKGQMNLGATAPVSETEDDYSAKKARAGKDIGKPGKNFAKIAKSAGKRYGSKEKGEKVAGAVLAKLRGLKEAERPSDDSDMGAGLGAGRSQTTFEGAKPDFLDMDKDGNKKESMKKAVADKKKKKKVDESMNHRINAARLEGKSHGLLGQAHSGKRYEDLEELKAYHEGYKEGLDECYGQGVYEAGMDEGMMGAIGGGLAGGLLGGGIPGMIAGSMLGSELGGDKKTEARMPATVSGMASQEMQEGEEFGAYDYEQLAQALYDKHPNLNTSGSLVINLGYKLAKEMFGPTVAKHSFNYNEDFPSDFVSAYAYLQDKAKEVDESLMSSGAGAVSKLGGKVLPGVGATLAAQDAYKRQKAGDTTGAVISGLTGAAGLVPGVGIAASLTGAGIQAARDKVRTGSWFPDEKQIAAASQKDSFTESLEIQLQKLLSESNEKVDEGLSVTISKGQQGAPDSVSVSAQDGEADQLLALIKGAGLGLFGDEKAVSNYGAPSGSSEVNSPGGIEVVGDHDGMMGIMKKLSGIEQSGDADYADEESEEGEEGCGCEGECDCAEQCNECGGMGMHEASCSSNGKEMVDEVESEDQQEFEVAEDNAPDSGEAESTADEDAEAEEDKALAGADSGDEEEINEWAALAGLAGRAALGAAGSFAGNTLADKFGKKTQTEENELDEEQLDELGPLAGLALGAAGSFLGNKLAGAMSEEDEELDEEQVDEISKNKLSRYVSKAVVDAHNDARWAGETGDSDASDKAFKRVLGIKSAAARLGDMHPSDVKNIVNYRKSKVDEWANNAGDKGTDASFERDIEFMTNIISGGLNKRKSTGQTTAPVIASQTERQHSQETTSINESINDWQKLAGIKKL